MGSKVCSLCFEDKPLSAFHKRGTGLRAECGQCNSAKRRNWYSKNRAQVSKRKAAYYQEHREKLLSYSKSRKKIAAERKRARLRVDLNFRLANNLRSRLSQAVRKNYSGSSAVENLGCSLADFGVYLEGKFEDGMSWSNYGRGGWHIDHIIPLCKFDLEDPEQLRKACYHTNLQPLWSVDNLTKGGKY